MKTNKPTDNNLGCWNSYVASGEDKEERNKRLSQAPSNLRDDIKRHVQTVFKLRGKK